MDVLYQRTLFWCNTLNTYQNTFTLKIFCKPRSTVMIESENTGNTECHFGQPSVIEHFDENANLSSGSHKKGSHTTCLTRP